MFFSFTNNSPNLSATWFKDMKLNSFFRNYRINFIILLHKKLIYNNGYIFDGTNKANSFTTCTNP